jgi:hypothetical protein
LTGVAIGLTGVFGCEKTFIGTSTAFSVIENAVEVPMTIFLVSETPVSAIKKTVLFVETAVGAAQTLI